MLNLAEYRRKADRLADHLPWAALVAPGVVLNKDGSFQRSFAYRGPDLESATEAELVGAAARLNNMLRRFGSGWAMFFEAAREPALGYPKSSFPDPVSALVDLERQASFEGGSDHYESRYVLTLLYLPPADASDSAQRRLIEGGEAQGRDWRQALERFTAETDRAADLLSEVLAEIAPMDDEATLTFLHGCISSRRHVVKAPPAPVYLDALLVDEPLTGGLRPILGDRHLRTLTILGFPNLSRPGILDALNHQNLDYRWVTRFIALDKTEAGRALNRIRRQWFNKRKSVGALLREVLYNQPAPLIDSNADNQVDDSDLALQALGSDEVAFGYLTATITLFDIDPARADEKARIAQRIVNGLGFTCIAETVNSVEAWLSSLPGHAYANVRQPLVHTLNLAHLMPLSCVWAGPSENAHLGGPALLYAETKGSTPFRLSTHVGDVGHMLVVGPTGAGKSVLLAILALQFRRYAGAQIVMFDKGLSARAAVLACGGTHLKLGLGASELAFQPLKDIDQPETLSWAADWIAALLEAQKVAVTPQVKDVLWSALRSLATAPPSERTMTGLNLLLQSNALKAALQPFTLEGPLGPLLDAAEDKLAVSDFHCFETEELMASPSAVQPVLTFLFHRLETQFTGRPTLLVLDEAWVYLDHPLFAQRIREWLKTLRKKNVAVVFATQSIADISESTIAPAILESCPQRIFLANPSAIEPASRSAYERFGLNKRQVELIARAAPKRHYYLQSARGNRLFELGLGPIALALCGSSDPASQLRIDRILEDPGGAGFAAEFLKGAGLDWAAELLPEASH